MYEGWNYASTFKVSVSKKVEFIRKTKMTNHALNFNYQILSNKKRIVRHLNYLNAGRQKSI